MKSHRTAPDPSSDSISLAAGVQPLTGTNAGQDHASAQLVGQHDSVRCAQPTLKIAVPDRRPPAPKARREHSLSALLAEAIEQVTEEHRDTCDVADPISPSATVAILRLCDGLIDHLVLGDSVLVLDRADGAPLVVGDPREVTISRSYLPALKAAAEGSDEYHRVLRDLRARRNQPGGFWVAKDDPLAANEAITGSCPIPELTGAVLLSNGASRIVDRFGLSDWPGVIAVLTSNGPAEIIHRVRQAEARHAVAADDATIAHCTDLGGACPPPAEPARPHGVV